MEMAIEIVKPKVKRGAGWVWFQTILLFAYILVPRSSYWMSLPRVILGLGVLLAGWGFMLLIASARAMGWKNISPFPRPSKNTPFTTDGPYRFIRHPMYLGVILMALGWPLADRHETRFFLGLAVSVFYILKTRREELYLREAYPEYGDYAARTKGFLPGLY